jgi:hypothetical protein
VKISVGAYESMNVSQWMKMLGLECMGMAVSE